MNVMNGGAFGEAHEKAAWITVKSRDKKENRQTTLCNRFFCLSWDVWVCNLAGRRQATVQRTIKAFLVPRTGNNLCLNLAIGSVNCTRTYAKRRVDDDDDCPKPEAFVHITARRIVISGCTLCNWRFFFTAFLQYQLQWHHLSARQSLLGIFFCSLKLSQQKYQFNKSY